MEEDNRLTVEEINLMLSVNRNSKRIDMIKGNEPDKLTLEDIRDLKNSRDYLDKLFKSLTQTLRNDTYKGSLCQSCNKPKSTFKILCFDCATK